MFIIRNLNLISVQSWAYLRLSQKNWTRRLCLDGPIRAGYDKISKLLAPSVVFRSFPDVLCSLDTPPLPFVLSLASTPLNASASQRQLESTEPFQARLFRVVSVTSGSAGGFFRSHTQNFRDRSSDLNRLRACHSSPYSLAVSLVALVRVVVSILLRLKSIMVYPRVH